METNMNKFIYFNLKILNIKTSLWYANYKKSWTKCNFDLLSFGQVTN